MGTPAARGLTQAAGAGHGEAGDAPSQGPAQEDVLSAQPKPANPDKPTNSTVAILETTPRDSGLVMTRPKPEKRKNAKERAKDKFAKDKEKTTGDGTTPMTATAKSEVESKAARKAATKVASKAAKAERKAKRTAAKAA